MRRLGWVVVGALSLLGRPLLAADDKGKGEQHEQSLKMEDLPAPVQETFRTEAKGGQVEELQKKTTSSGKVIYEGEIVTNGKGTELEVSEDGKVVKREKAHDESKEHEAPQGGQYQK